MLQRSYFEPCHPLTRRVGWIPLDPSIRKTLKAGTTASHVSRQLAGVLEKIFRTTFCRLREATLVKQRGCGSPHNTRHHGKHNCEDCEFVQQTARLNPEWQQQLFCLTPRQLILLEMVVFPCCFPC